MKNKVILFFIFLFGLQIHGAFCMEGQEMQEVSLDCASSMMQSLQFPGLVQVNFEYRLGEVIKRGTIFFYNPQTDIAIKKCAYFARRKAKRSNEVCVVGHLYDEENAFINFHGSQGSVGQFLRTPRSLLSRVNIKLFPMQFLPYDHVETFFRELRSGEIEIVVVREAEMVLGKISSSDVLE